MNISVANAQNLGTSLFFAKFFGLYLVIFVLLFIFRKNEMNALVNKIVKDDALLALSGIVSLVIGLVVVINHSKFTYDWRVLVTLLGYLCILKGILRLGFPQNSKDMIKKMRSKNCWFGVQVITGVIALVLLYYGFGY